MNPELSFIFKRRSVRSYAGEPVSKEMVKDLLEAAMAAPSACAKDPWRFVVVRDRDRLARIADGLPNGKTLPKAAVGIVVAGDMDAAHSGELSYLLQDCSAAIENILLAATAFGLGACWLGIHPREDRVAHVMSLMKMPDSWVPVSVIAIGWPVDSQPPRTRYKETSVFYETC